MALTEGIVVKARNGIAKLDCKGRKTDRWLRKCKFRDIKAERF